MGCVGWIPIVIIITRGQGVTRQMIYFVVMLNLAPSSTDLYSVPNLSGLFILRYENKTHAAPAQTNHSLVHRPV
jgi:hypothetical protein